jgi:hypothetical protein
MGCSGTGQTSLPWGLGQANRVSPSQGLPSGASRAPFKKVSSLAFSRLFT